MLGTGIIQESNNLFKSLMLVIKEKDGFVAFVLDNYSVPRGVIARFIVTASKMNCGDVVDLSTDDEAGVVDVKPVKLELDSGIGTMQQRYSRNTGSTAFGKFKSQPKRQEAEENKSTIGLSNSHSSASVMEEGQSHVDDIGITSSSICPAPISRQFWQAGNYNDTLGSKVTLQNGKSHLHVHPMFLHSNATSHKWAFGAVAELLDNAIDEIQNGATLVIVDQITNPRDGNPALLIQDDGGGMDPEAMRRCMSFGFSDKKSKSTIGQYGNGFKTSSMRLGADVIVFSRHLGDSTGTQSIGLLSYTFLTRTGQDRIVVPRVDYGFDASTGSLSLLHGREHFTPNMSKLLQWSPYSTKEELLKQFDDIGSHGTKIIIYNLWFTDAGILELDFDTDLKDIRISGDIKKFEGDRDLRSMNEPHIANRLHYSLRAYASILYMRIPESFCIILRGQVVQHHNIAAELKYPEFILYQPQSGEGSALTTIGFLKEAPHVNIHGFNVYHKNRLILPFWHVVSYQVNSRGRGVVGVLEANFVQPTHNKQDFERTPLFQKLEARLKEMTWEYWDYHCGLLGYMVRRKTKVAVSKRVLPTSNQDNSIFQPVVVDKTTLAAGSILRARPNSEGLTEQGSRKRKDHGILLESAAKKMYGEEANSGLVSRTQPYVTPVGQPENKEKLNLLLENKKFRARCSEFEKKEEELNQKVTRLRSELILYKSEYDRLLAELQSLDVMKEEKNV